jgi:hypothetical protein
MSQTANTTETETTYTCNRCGEAKPASEFYVFGGRRQLRCKACENRRRVDSRNEVQVNESRTYGVEIEFYAPVSSFQIAEALNAAGVTTGSEYYNHTTRSYWKVVTDASLNQAPYGMSGLELVSPPLKGKAGLKMVRKALEVLNTLGCEVNKTCGLHVHHDARDLDLPSWKRALSMYVRFETVIDSVHPTSRRDNTYCRRMVRWGGVESTVAEINSARLRQTLTNLWGTRYTKVNTQAFLRHGTLEYRQHAGTLNADKVCNWIVLTQLMLTAAKQDRAYTSTETLADLMQAVGARGKLSHFFAARQAALAA